MENRDLFLKDLIDVLNKHNVQLDVLQHREDKLPLVNFYFFNEQSIKYDTLSIDIGILQGEVFNYSENDNNPNYVNSYLTK